MPIAVGYVVCVFAAVIAACATAFAASVSFHCASELPSSANMVGTFSEGPWCVHSYEAS